MIRQESSVRALPRTFDVTAAVPRALALGVLLSALALAGCRRSEDLSPPNIHYGETE